MTKPHGIIVLGDFGDFYCISDHKKIPYHSKGLKWEVEQINDLGLDLLDSIGAKEKIFISGNHEDRLTRYLQSHAQELWGMVSVEEALYLKQRGWTHVPYKQHIKIGKSYWTHEIGKCGDRAHIDLLKNFEETCGMGHNHMLGYWNSNTIEGRPRMGMSFGCLLDMRYAEYMHNARMKRFWCHALGLGNQTPDGTIHAAPIPFIDRKILIEGQIYG